MAALSRGWYQVAFTRELSEPMTVPKLAAPIIIVRDGHRVRAFDAVCPHRGAHLGYGGRLDDGGEAMICPFHGHRVGLGKECDSGFRARELPVLEVGGLVFVAFSPGSENGFGKAMQTLQQNHRIVPGFTIQLPVAAEMVIENGFDGQHFRPVHRVLNEPLLKVQNSELGEFVATGTFELPMSPSAGWYEGSPGKVRAAVPFVAKAYSPGLVISQFGGDYPYAVLTAATPLSSGECVLRLSVMVPPDRHGVVPSEQSCHFLLDKSREGILQDLVIWEHLVPDAPSRYTAADEAVVEFRRFCRRLRDTSLPVVANKSAP